MNGQGEAVFLPSTEDTQEMLVQWPIQLPVFVGRVQKKSSSEQERCPIPQGNRTERHYLNKELMSSCLDRHSLVGRNKEKNWLFSGLIHRKLKCLSWYGFRERRSKMPQLVIGVMLQTSDATRNQGKPMPTTSVGSRWPEPNQSLLRYPRLGNLALLWYCILVL